MDVHFQLVMFRYCTMPRRAIVERRGRDPHCAGHVKILLSIAGRNFSVRWVAVLARIVSSPLRNENGCHTPHSQSSFSKLSCPIFAGVGRRTASFCTWRSTQTDLNGARASRSLRQRCRAERWLRLRLCRQRGREARLP